MTDFGNGDQLLFGTAVSVSRGDGATVLTGELQYAERADGLILWIGTDNAPGADFTILLEGQVVRDNLEFTGNAVSFVADTSAPSLLSATVDGAQLELSFSERLDAANGPSADNFEVVVNGAKATVSGLAVDALSGVVTLTLATAVPPGAKVTLTYQDPTTSDDVDAIQDVNGNDLGSLIDTAVTNLQALPPKPKPPRPEPEPEPEPQPPISPPPQPTSGADLLRGTSGDDEIDGGTGLDIFRIEARRDDVALTRNEDGSVTISHPELGTDTLNDIELLRFDDMVEIVAPPENQVAQHGWAEFSESIYLAQNPDVADAVANGFFSSGLEHYQRHGAAEERQLPQIAFGTRFYTDQNQDVAQAIERGEFHSALEHYTLHGAAEGRSPNVLFDSAWYLEQNPDVAAAIEANLFADAYTHFQAYGWREGRDPSAWMDTSDYLARYIDVQTSGLNPLDHFLNYGIHEGRTIQAQDDGLWVM